MKSMAPGGGGRFAALESKLARRPGVADPAALAASIGRKKYGSKKMTSFSKKGEKRSNASALSAGLRK